MSDKPYFHEPDHTIHLRTWAFGQMVWGAFLAGLFLAAIGAVLGALWGISLLLPEDSKTAPDPLQRGSLEQPLTLPGHDLA